LISATISTIGAIGMVSIGSGMQHAPHFTVAAERFRVPPRAAAWRDFSAETAQASPA
jgi:hypothetical protein